MNAYILSQLPLLLGFMALLLLAALKPWGRERFSTWIAVAALAAGALLVHFALPAGEYFGGAIRVTDKGRILAGLCLALSALAVFATGDYLDKVHVHAADWKAVIVAMGMGMSTLCLANDLATLFIAYELVSIPSYVLAGFSHRDPRSNEAGVKYLLLGILTSALFLLGLSFLYGATGEINLVAIREHLAAANPNPADLALARIALGFVLAAVFFKVGVAPFHSWLPDVYQGSNYAALAIIAGPVKIAVFGMISLLLWGPFAALSATWIPAVLAGAALSVVAGNLQAIVQTDIKRLLAYSAVVNAGFLLLGILSRAPGAFLLYLGAYGLATLGGLSAFMALGTRNADVDELADLAGVGKSHRWLALALTVVLLSYAGIPLTAGFAAKFSVVLEALRAGGPIPWLTMAVLVLAVVSSLISFYFYFQIVKAVWIQPAAGAQPARDLRWPYLASLGLCVALILCLGAFLPVPGL